MAKFKTSPVILLVAIVGISLISFFCKSIFDQPKVDIVLSKPTQEAIIQNVTRLATPISNPLSQTKTFPHELLPGFNITIPNSWYISGIKQFGEKDTIGFSSTYFGNLPNENSMAVRVFKDGTFFDLIFDLIFDDQNSCSNNLHYVDIGKGWYQIKDKGRIYYTKNLTFNDSPIGLNEKFKVCTMSGITLNNKPHIKVSPYSEGAILLENIRIYGNPNQDILNEINSIINSIVL